MSWMPALTIVETCLKDRLRNIMRTWQWYGKSIMIEMNCEEPSKVLNTICYTTVHNSFPNNQEDYNKCLLDAWNPWTREIHQNPVECWSPWQAQKWKRERVGRKALFCPFLLMPFHLIINTSLYVSSSHAMLTFHLSLKMTISSMKFKSTF